MSTKPANEERLFIVPAIALTDHGAAAECMTKLYAIMLAPEDQEKQDKFFNDFLRDIVKRTKESGTLDGDGDFWKEYGQEIYDLGQGGEYGSFDKDPFSGHKGVTASPAVRGPLAGQILYHLIETAGVETLVDARQKVIEYFSPAEIEHADDIATLQGKPGEDLLRVIWSEFKNVAHLWAADFVFFNTKGKSACTTARFGANFSCDDFRFFLSVASYFRIKLIEYPKKTATGAYLIKNPDQVLNVLLESEDVQTSPFPPVCRK